MFISSSRYQKNTSVSIDSGPVDEAFCDEIIQAIYHVRGAWSGGYAINVRWPRSIYHLTEGVWLACSD